MIDVRFFHHRQELARIRRQRLDIAALAFGIDGVERERGFTRARQPGNHDQTVARQLQIDVFEVMRAGTANADKVHGRSQSGLTTEYYSASKWPKGGSAALEVGAREFDRKVISRYYLAPFSCSVVRYSSCQNQAVVKITTEECHVG